MGLHQAMNYSSLPLLLCFCLVIIDQFPGLRGEAEVEDEQHGPANSYFYRLPTRSEKPGYTVRILKRSEPEDLEDDTADEPVDEENNDVAADEALDDFNQWTDDSLPE